MNQTEKNLARLLGENHYKNEFGCWTLDFHKIPGLIVLARTTNCTSGIVKWKGRRWYFQDSAYTGTFEVQPA